jgi:hypothetical protein
MTVNLSMLAGAGAQFFDNNGVILSGGKLYTYAAGTTTPQITYTTSAGNVAHTNPIVLNSAGRVASGGEIWLTDAVAYKFVLETATAITIATYDNVTGNASGIYAAFASSSGSSLVGYLPAETNAVQTTVQAKLRQTISVQDFGAVGDGVTDDTTAIQNAFNYVSGKPNFDLEIANGTYLVSSVTLSNANGIAIKGGGALQGKPTGTYDAVLIIKNTADFVIHGRFGVSAGYNTGYGCGIWVYQEGAGATALLMFDNVIVVGAKIGWKFGSETYPDAVVSEITVKGGYLFGCPTAVKCVGSQTVINFIGTILQAGFGSGTGAWLALPQAIIHTVGSYVGVQSGEMLLVETTGAAVLIQPIASPLLGGNFYGSVVITGVLLETASQYIVINNPSALTPIAPANAQASTRFIANTGYHSQDAFSMVSVATDYLGDVTFSNNNFFAGSTRTLGNIDATGNSNCDIYCDAQSFGRNFIQGLVGIQGGIIHFDRRLIFQAQDCDATALPSGVLTKLVFTSLLNTEDTQRFNVNYSTSTGVFTVPAGGLRSVSVNTVVKTSAPTFQLDLSVILNGTTSAGAASMMGGAGNSGYNKITVELGDLTAGTTIQVSAVQYGGSSTPSGGAVNQFNIVARN